MCKISSSILKQLCPLYSDHNLQELRGMFVKASVLCMKRFTSWTKDGANGRLPKFSAWDQRQFRRSTAMSSERSSLSDDETDRFEGSWFWMSLRLQDCAPPARWDPIRLELNFCFTKGQKVEGFYDMGSLSPAFRFTQSRYWVILRTCAGEGSWCSCGRGNKSWSSGQILAPFSFGFP